MTRINFDWTNIKIHRIFANLRCGKQLTHETRVLCMSYYTTQVELSRVGRCHCTRRRNVFISHVAVRGKPRRKNWKPLFLSLSLSLSLHFVLRTFSPWLLLTYFSPSPLWRKTSLCIRGVLHANEEHAWSRTVTHGLSRIHTGRYTYHTSKRIAYIAAGETRKGKASPFLSSRLISVIATKVHRIFVCASYTGRWRCSMTNCAI